MNTPGDYIGWGIALIVISAAVGGLAAAVTETVEMAWVGLPATLIGGILLQIGVIAWGVAIGVRTATADRAPR